MDRQVLVITIAFQVNSDRISQNDLSEIEQCLALSTLFIALPGYAQFAPEEGISGEISLNAGVISSTSNFNVDGDIRGKRAQTSWPVLAVLLCCY